MKQQNKMVLGTLATSLLGKILTGLGVIGLGEGRIRAGQDI